MQLPLDGRAQPHQVIFHQIVVGPGAHRLDRHRFADRAGDNDEWKVQRRLFEDRERGHGVEVRHRVIAKNYVPLPRLKRGLHRGCGLHPFGGQRIAGAR